MAAADPANKVWQGDLAVAYAKRAQLEMDAGNLDLAEAHLAKSLAIREELARRDPGDAMTQDAIGRIHQSLGDLAVRRREPDQAIGHFRTALEVRERRLADDPSPTRTLLVVSTRLRLAEALLPTAPEQARDQLDRAEAEAAGITEVSLEKDRKIVSDTIARLRARLR